MNAIDQRPEAVNSRDVPGHWEGDLITGALNGSAIATLVERSTQFVILGHLGREHTAEAVRDCLIAAVRHLPASLRGTLTWDQGAEMAEHRAFSTATTFEVYFADPGSPWQRGSNENTNGLLEWSPKVGHRNLVSFFREWSDVFEEHVELSRRGLGCRAVRAGLYRQLGCSRS